MPYAYIIAAASIFAAGFGLSHQLDKVEIQSLQMAIERGNAEAEMTLQAAKSRVDQAAIEAAAANKQLESSHAQSIQTINAYRADLDNRLHDRSASRRNAVPACTGSGNLDEATGAADVSERSIADLAFRADQVAAYAQACWKFVSNNCGISQ